MSNETTRPTKVRWRRAAFAFVLGVLAGVCAHYIIYRLSLPSTPFIYVAF